MSIPFDPYSIPCPWCDADVGEQCRSAANGLYTCAHAHRLLAAQARDQDPAPSTDEAVQQPVQEDTMNGSFDPYSVPCPWCHAFVGEGCRTVVGGEPCFPHANRKSAARNQDPAPSTDEAVQQPVQEDTNPMNSHQMNNAIDACIAGVMQAQAQPHVDKAMALVERTKVGQGIRVKGGTKDHPWFLVYLHIGHESWSSTESDETYTDVDIVTMVTRALINGQQVRRMAVTK